MSWSNGSIAYRTKSPAIAGLFFGYTITAMIALLGEDLFKLEAKSGKYKGLELAVFFGFSMQLTGIIL